MAGSELADDVVSGRTDVFVTMSDHDGHIDGGDLGRRVSRDHRAEPGQRQEIRTRLNQIMEPRYFARLTPYVTYETIAIGEVQGIRPDVGIWGGGLPAGGSNGGVDPDSAYLQKGVKATATNAGVR